MQAGFTQIQLLQKADAGVDVTAASVDTCGNPTFTAGQPNNNHLAAIAPQPLACDKQGAGPCGATTAAAGSGSGSGSSGGSGSGGTGSSGTGSSGTGSSGTGAAAGGAATGGVDATSTDAGGATDQIDPNTGQLVSNGGGSNAGSAANPTTLVPPRAATSI